MSSIFSIKSFFKQDFFMNAIVHWVFIVAFVINSACFGFLAFFLRPVDFPIILHYNVYFGVDMIGEWWHVYYLPTISLVIFVINVAMARFFYKNGERIMSYMLLLASLMVQIGIAIAVGSIIRINY